MREETRNDRNMKFLLRAIGMGSEESSFLKGCWLSLGNPSTYSVVATLNFESEHARTKGVERWNFPAVKPVKQCMCGKSLTPFLPWVGMTHTRAKSSRGT
jgi:hypothetical protein